jgi:endoglycosylceramidase
VSLCRATAGLALVLLLAGCSGGDGGSAPDDPAGTASGGEEEEGQPLAALHAVRGETPGIFDEQGRQVLLRGINLNVLAEYGQANEQLETVVPLTDTDWEEMAAQGFNVVRLLVSWSRLEPEPGQYHEDYLAEIEAAVRAAEAQGIYTVIDMHQDAWGPSLASPDGVVCADGRTPAIGWDGAPEWATLTGGADTCVGSRREDNAAVKAAWDAFYRDDEGIRAALVATWGRLAGAFADDAAVAGFDLLNEPGYGDDVDGALVGLADFYAQTIEAIRSAEEAEDGFAHPVFFEYLVDGQAVAPGFSDDPGLVFAPHVYGGSISEVPLEVNYAYAEGLARDYGTTLWVGEYGWFDEPEENQAAVRQFGALEDAARAGGAWWQWRQACGDPHSVGTPGGAPAETYLVYHEMGCPSGETVGTDLGVVPEWQEVVSRPYPRATPGVLDTLTSDGAARTLEMTATGAEPGGSVELWVPAGDTPAVTGSGVAGAVVTDVPGGYRVTVTTCAAAYTVAVGHPDGEPVPDACG